MKKKNSRKYSTPEEREKLLAKVDALVAKGDTIATASRKLGSYQSQVYAWRKQAKQLGTKIIVHQTKSSKSLPRQVQRRNVRSITSVPSGRVVAFIGSPDEVIKAVQGMLDA